MSQKFINSIKQHAINAASNSGMLASVLAAQACLETGYGTSDLAKNANNLFGIKGTYNGQSYTKRTAEQKSNGQVYYVNAAFRKYPSYTESFKDRIAFFTSSSWRTKIYKPVTDTKPKGYKAQVKALHESPYATDTQYDKKLLNIIEQYKLYEWDGATVTKKHLIVAGHGGNDPGAIGNGTNERDFTRAYYVDQIAKYINNTPGHSAVVYDKRQNMYLDTYNGGGMYWAKKQGFDTVTEIHEDAATATATGGHIIVYNGFIPDAIDLGMRDSIHKYVGTRYSHKGYYGISGRNNLLQVNVAAEIGVNYRLVELGFITNPTDFRNFKNNNEAIAKDFAQAITGKAAGSNKTDKNVSDKVVDTSPNMVKDRDSWGWHWSGTLTVTADAGIQVYLSDQFMRAKNKVGKDSNLAKGQFINFDHLFLINGIWQVRGKYAQASAINDYIFIPVGEKKHGQTFEQAIAAGDLWVDIEHLNTDESASGVTNWYKKGSVKK